MIDERFVFIAVAFNILGSISYLVGILKGIVKPNKVSWFFWALAPLIVFVAQVKQGVGLSSLLTFSVGAGPVIIFFASFLNKKSAWKITKFDLICGMLSLTGLILWMLTRVGNLAILFAILADALAGIPTLVKAYKVPETENYQAFLFAGIAAIITLLTIRQWDFAHSAFPAYILLFNLIAFPLIKFKLGKRIY